MSQNRSQHLEVPKKRSRSFTITGEKSSSSIELSSLPVTPNAKQLFPYSPTSKKPSQLEQTDAQLALEYKTTLNAIQVINDAYDSIDTVLRLKRKNEEYSHRCIEKQNHPLLSSIFHDKTDKKRLTELPRQIQDLQKKANTTQAIKQKENIAYLYLQLAASITDVNNPLNAQHKLMKALLSSFIKESEITEINKLHFQWDYLNKH